MNIQIDNYYISVNNGYMRVCIDGQNIIDAYTKHVKREEIISIAIKLINDYNKRHDLEWGRLTVKKEVKDCITCEHWYPGANACVDCRGKSNWRQIDE